MVAKFIKLAVLLVGLFPVQSMAQDVESISRITVSGEGSVRVAPDFARISIGVSHIEDTAAAALAGMTDGLNAVFAQLSAAGIDPTDMQTGTLYLSRQYNRGISSVGDDPAGFEASSSVTVFVRDLNSLGDVLDAVVQGGANTLNDLQFDVADRAPHVRAARQAAVADARNAAETYAAAAGMAVGDVVTIIEVGNGGGPMIMAEASMARGGPVPVATGEIDIRQSVQIVYMLTNE